MSVALFCVVILVGREWLLVAQSTNKLGHWTENKACVIAKKHSVPA